MGKAFVGLSNDVTAVYWNPAGLARVYNNQLGVVYGSNFDGSNMCFAGFTQPVVYFGTFAAGGIYYAFKNETVSGAYLSLGKEFYSWSLGLTLKGFNQSFSSGTAFGFGADAGISFYDLDFLTLSGAVINLIKPTFALDITRSYPLTLRGGACISLYEHRINFTIDIEKKENAEFSFHGGIEYKPYSYFSIRGGINHTVPTAGFGLSSGNYFIDFSVTSLSTYSNDFNHQITAGIKFGSFDMGIKVSPKTFSPAGKNKTVKITFIGATKYGTKSWQVAIRDVKRNMIKKLEGRDTPPLSYIWDAKLENGDMVKDGDYEIELTLIDKVNEIERVINNVTVDTRIPSAESELEIQ